jgi:hypothetical protein
VGKLEDAERPLLEPKILSRHDPADQSRRPEPAAYLGTIWDHTLCAVMNDAFMNVLHAHIPPHTRGDQGERVSTIYWGSKWFALQR